MNYGYVTASTAASDIQTVKAAPTGAFTAATDKESNATTAYSCILIPQTITAGKLSVDITIGGKLYTWTSTTDVELNSGASHLLNLKVGKDSAVMGSISSCPWIEGGETQMTTD